jgi:hypothetical protein
MQPTSEQQHAVDLFGTGRPQVVEAGAGTGKTTTLAVMARSTPRTGTYVAFNKSIAADAGRKMPMTVAASTMHSLAFRSVGRRLRHRLDAPRINSTQLARLMGVGPVSVAMGVRTKVMQPSYLAGHVMKAVARFCQSAADEPTERHFPYIEGIDMPDSNGNRTWANNNQLAHHLLGHLTDAWDDLTQTDGRLRFTHDVYLKLWQLGRHEIPGDFVLFDEAQDANGVMLAALEHAAEQGQQVVFVGDTQQQIYEWRGAVNALAQVPDATRCFLTQSFRFGPEVAEVANLILTELDAELRLVGTPTIPSRVGPIPHGQARAVLCRTNATAVNTVLSLQATGQQAFLVGGGEEVVRFARAAAELQAGEKTYHPELACFDSWGEVQEYVANDPQGDELRLLVRLLDDYGVQIVLDALAGLVGEDQADVVVSTAHKAKGREWATVHLATDFDGREGQTGLEPGEWRLLYVAATRAKLGLDPTWCKPIQRLREPAEPTEVPA